MRVFLSFTHLLLFFAKKWCNSSPSLSPFHFPSPPPLENRQPKPILRNHQIYCHCFRKSLPESRSLFTFLTSIPSLLLLFLWIFSLSSLSRLLFSSLTCNCLHTLIETSHNWTRFHSDLLFFFHPITEPWSFTSFLSTSLCLQNFFIRSSTAGQSQPWKSNQLFLLSLHHFCLSASKLVHPLLFFRSRIKFHLEKLSWSLLLLQ